MSNLRSLKLKLCNQGGKMLFGFLIMTAWIIGSCSLPEVPIEDGAKTQTTTTTITATTVRVLPSETETPRVATQTLAAPSSTPTITTVVEVEPTSTQTNGIPPDGVEDVENPRFGIQPGTPLGMANIVRTEAGCNWMGVGGQVLDQLGMPVVNLIVEVGGELDGTPLLELGIAGGEVVFGPGGYVVTISDRPINSDGTIWIQLFDLSGKPQTKKIYLTTYSNCERNLLLVNFNELYASTSTKVYLPAINKGE